jgi:hypothetical protein
MNPIGSRTMMAHSADCAWAQPGHTWTGPTEIDEKRYCTCGAAYPEIALGKRIAALEERVLTLEAMLSKSFP